MHQTKNDAFSNCHPLVNFLFFVGAIGFSVVIQHPAYLAAGALCALLYYLLLSGIRGMKILWGLVPIFLLFALVNPLFNTYGETVLFYLFGKPYTLEALYYGMAVGGTFCVMMLWFGCYNKVLTSDKFTSLFGNLIPAISLLLVMVLRMIPNFIRKASQILGARTAIGKGPGGNTKEKLASGTTVLSTLTDWALEGSILTGDSMRARGYGTGKRTSFRLYTMKLRDWLLLAALLILGAGVIALCVLGGVDAQYTPTLVLAPVSGNYWLGFAAYSVFLLIPSVLHIKESVQWYISRSRI